jgi:hypothetical protein
MGITSSDGIMKLRRALQGERPQSRTQNAMGCGKKSQREAGWSNSKRIVTIPAAEVKLISIEGIA